MEHKKFKSKAFLIFEVLLLFIILPGCIRNTMTDNAEESGSIVQGIRQIPLNLDKKEHAIHVYRGDYVRFLTENNKSAALKIPDMGIDVFVPTGNPKQPYIKFDNHGTFNFTLDGNKGIIYVHRYKRENYIEVSSKKAKELISKISPIILDVRTYKEFNSGHLKDSSLLSLDIIQDQIREITRYRNRPVLIYSFNGNRSTVASRLLLDNGFIKVYNLRQGIKGWIKDGYEIERD